MLLVPLAAALVAVVFAGHLARQFARRRRPHALAWALALGLYAAGSAGVAASRDGRIPSAATCWGAASPTGWPARSASPS
jgi:hypothetical protein